MSILSYHCFAPTEFVIDLQRVSILMTAAVTIDTASLVSGSLHHNLAAKVRSSMNDDIGRVRMTVSGVSRN